MLNHHEKGPPFWENIFGSLFPFASNKQHRWSYKWVSLFFFSGGVGVSCWDAGAAKNILSSYEVVRGHISAKKELN